MNPIKELAKYGQSVYLDEISRSMLENGHLAGLIANNGIRGVTSNPAIFEKAIAQSNDYDGAIKELALAGNNSEQIYETLVIEDIQKTADLFRELYDESQAKYGYVSLEVSPLLANDADGTIAEARQLWKRLDRPNVFIKVPSTKAGLVAIEQLISEGINVNVTLIFGLERYKDVARAYTNGLQKRLKDGKSIENVASVASFFLSRIDVKLDPIFADKAPELQGKAAVASSKAAYQIYKDLFGADFKELKAKGAKAQRLLWASTGTKNPEYPDLLYVETVIGDNTVNTMPAKTLDAFLDHGKAADTIEDNMPETNKILKQIADLGIDMDVIAQELEDEGVAKFVKPFDSLMATIETARKAANDS